MFDTFNGSACYETVLSSTNNKIYLFIRKFKYSIAYISLIIAIVPYYSARFKGKEKLGTFSTKVSENEGISHSQNLDGILIISLSGVIQKIFEEKQSRIKHIRIRC